MSSATPSRSAPHGASSSPKRRLDEPQPVGKFGRQRRAAGDGRGVAVERDHARAALEQRAGVAAGAESAVEIKAAGFAPASAASVSASRTGNMAHAGAMRKARARSRAASKRPAKASAAQI